MRYSDGLMRNNILVSALVIGVICSSLTVFAMDNIQDLIVAAQNGDPQACGVLGEIYRRGESVETDYAAAYKWTKLAAESDNVLGIYNLAVFYEKGICVEKDTIRAEELYAEAEGPLKKLASEGDPRACIDLGYNYEYRYDDPELFEEAVKLYRIAADSGYAFAQYVLGFKYYYGSVVEKDVEEGLKWLKTAADGGCRPAQFLLGNILFNGIGVEVNETAAQNLSKKIDFNDEGVEIDEEAPQRYFSLSESPNTVYNHNGFTQPGDYIIPDLFPPKYQLKITEGSCGEACFWSVLYNRGENVTQMEINRAAGSPGRGLRSYELQRVLKYYGLENEDRIYGNTVRFFCKYFKIFDVFSNKDKHYRNTVAERIIPEILKGNPVLLGVKRYPDKIKWWDLDHFILLAGYNEETDEIIYNDFTKRKRIKVDKLFNKNPGYSLVNRYHLVNYIIFRRQ